MRTAFSLGILAIFIVGATTIVVVNPKSPQAPIPNGTTSAGSDTLNPGSNKPVKTPVGTPAPTPSTTGTAVYTLAQVAAHASASSCWTTINGKVYDVTAWISQHPGGANAILGLCGIDGSDAFNGQHGGQRRPATELAAFLIGDLGTVSSGASAQGALAPKASASGSVTPVVPVSTYNNRNDD